MMSLLIVLAIQYYKIYKSTLLKCDRISKAITDFKNKVISHYKYVKSVVFNYIKQINKIL